MSQVCRLSHQVGPVCRPENGCHSSCCDGDERATKHISDFLSLEHHRRWFWKRSRYSSLDEVKAIAKYAEVDKDSGYQSVDEEVTGNMESQHEECDDLYPLMEERQERNLSIPLRRRITRFCAASTENMKMRITRCQSSAANLLSGPTDVSTSSATSASHRAVSHASRLPKSGPATSNNDWEKVTSAASETVDSKPDMDRNSPAGSVLLRIVGSNNGRRALLRIRQKAVAMVRRIRGNQDDRECLVEPNSGISFESALDDESSKYFSKFPGKLNRSSNALKFLCGNAQRSRSCDSLLGITNVLHERVAMHEDMPCECPPMNSKDYNSNISERCSRLDEFDVCFGDEPFREFFPQLEEASSNCIQPASKCGECCECGECDERGDDGCSDMLELWSKSKQKQDLSYSRSSPDFRNMQLPVGDQKYVYNFLLANKDLVKVQLGEI